MNVRPFFPSNKIIMSHLINQYVVKSLSSYVKKQKQMKEANAAFSTASKNQKIANEEIKLAESHLIEQMKNKRNLFVELNGVPYELQRYGSNDDKIKITEINFIS